MSEMPPWGMRTRPAVRGNAPASDTTLPHDLFGSIDIPPEIPPETQRYHAVFGGIVTSMDNHTPNS
jgi:hypothetical protein